MLMRHLALAFLAVVLICGGGQGALAQKAPLSESRMTVVTEDVAPLDPLSVGNAKPIKQAAPSAEAAAQSQALSLRVRDRYAFSITGYNARLEVRVNDIPILYKLFREEETIDASFNEWLTIGENQFSIAVDRYDSEQPYGIGYQVYYQSPTQLPLGERLNLYTSAPKLFLPHRQSVQIKAITVPKMRLWDAAEIQMNDAEKQALMAALNQSRQKLIDAVGAADNAYLATYDNPIISDIDLAYGRITVTTKSTMERRKDLVRRFATLVNEPVQTSPELKAEDVKLDLVAGSRLVRVSRPDGSPVIKVGRGSVDFTIHAPIYGQIGGLWQQLR